MLSEIQQKDKDLMSPLILILKIIKSVDKKKKRNGSFPGAEETE